MTEFLQLDSKKIEIQWHQKRIKDRPTLVFLHEGLGCIRMWKDFPYKLSRKAGCPALIFSRFGHGDSDPDPLPRKINFMHTQALKILPEIIKLTQIKNYILIGHSDGGSIGIIFSGSPFVKGLKGLKGLVTLAAHVFCEQITMDSIQHAKILYEEQNLKQFLEKYHNKNSDNAFYGWNDVWLNPKFVHWNIEKYLGRINVPMLAIQGKQDQYGTTHQIVSIKNNVKNVETSLIEECRHSPHFDQQEKVLNIMTQFINQIDK